MGVAGVELRIARRIGEENLLQCVENPRPPRKIPEKPDRMIKSEPVDKRDEGARNRE
jgi:hypothetical protein